MRILLDVDGVILDFTEHWLQVAEYATGRRPVRVSDAWSMFDRYDVASPSDRAAIERELYTRPTDQMPLVQGAYSGVTTLLQIHDVYFVTTSLVPHPLWEAGRRRLFERLWGVDAAKRLCFMLHKKIVSGDVFVDDKLSNVEKWAEANPQGRAIHYDYDSGYDWQQLMRDIVHLSLAEHASEK